MQNEESNFLSLIILVVGIGIGTIMKLLLEIYIQP